MSSVTLCFISPWQFLLSKSIEATRAEFLKHRGAESTEKNTEKYFTKIELIGGFGYEGEMSSLLQLLEKSAPYHDLQLQNLR